MSQFLSIFDDHKDVDGDESMSSAEEDAATMTSAGSAAAKRRRKVAKKETVSSVDTLLPAFSSLNDAGADGDFRLHIIPLDEHKKLFPKTLGNSRENGSGSAETKNTTAAASRKRKTKSEPSSTAVVEESFYAPVDTTEHPQAVPYLHQVFQSIVDRQPHVNYERVGTPGGVGDMVSAMTGPEISKLLVTEARVQLPKASSDHDDLILAAAMSRPFTNSAGERVMRPVPACSRGNKCEGIIGEIRCSHPDFKEKVYAGHVLGVYMDEKELKRLVDDGVPPRNQRPCLLDLRKDIFTATIAASDEELVHVDPTYCRQVFRNYTHGPGSYKEHHTIRPSTRYNGIVDAIVRHDRMAITWFTDKDGVPRIDQSNIINKASGKEAKEETSEFKTVGKAKKSSRKKAKNKSISDELLNKMSTEQTFPSGAATTTRADGCSGSSSS